MECGISLFAGHTWMSLFTWVAFVAVATFVATISFARRDRSGGDPVSSAEIDRLSARIEEISRRLEAVEREERK